MGKLENVLVKFAYNSAKCGAVICPWLFYQPVVPDKVKALVKKK